MSTQYHPPVSVLLKHVERAFILGSRELESLPVSRYVYSEDFSFPNIVRQDQ